MSDLGDRIEERQRYARELVDIDNSSATYGFLKKYGNEVLDELMEVASDPLRSELAPESKGERIVYEVFAGMDLIDSVSQKKYRVKADADELNLLRKQLEEDMDEEYGRHELIAYLQVHGDPAVDKQSP